MKDIHMDWLLIGMVFIVGIFVAIVLVSSVKNCGKTKQSLSSQQVQQLSEVEKKETNRLFRKHGIWFAKEGEDGLWYFWRNKERCEFK